MSTTPGGGRRTNPLPERLIPACYGLLSIALAVALFPTSLRPVTPPPPTSAQLSPDAPPEDSEVLLSELGGARSSTAGAGIVGDAPGEDPTAVQPPQVTAPRRGKCFGNPPRQLESVYAGPCAPAWSGDNGGATTKGVTGTEIRVVVNINAGEGSYDGPVPDNPEPNESNAVRTLRVLQAYFNQNMEFYGRQLRFYTIRSAQDSNDPATSRSAAYRAAEEYKVFGAIMGFDPPELHEYGQRGVLTFHTGHTSANIYAQYRPYLWSATPDNQAMMIMGAEYICKRLVGNPPRNTGDPSFDYDAPREFGILAYNQGEGYRENAPLMRKLLQQFCGLEVAESYEYTFGDASVMSTGLARMRMAGVTSIIMLTDYITPSVVTQMADNSGYFPEWIISGFGGMDVQPTFFQTYSPRQWRNAFGYTVYEIPAALDDNECTRAYHSIDPDSNPHVEYCKDYNWIQFVQLASALQITGPDLTPHNLERALFDYGTHPPEPIWRIGGGYGQRPPGVSIEDYPANYTYPKYGIEFWYDPFATHPNGNPGAYRYMLDPGRFTFGAVPPGENPRLFEDGILTMPRN